MAEMKLDENALRVAKQIVDEFFLSSALQDNLKNKGFLSSAARVGDANTVARELLRAEGIIAALLKRAVPEGCVVVPRTIVLKCVDQLYLADRLNSHSLALELETMLSAAPKPEAPSSAHRVADGFGNEWDCELGLGSDECGLEIVRPGKVQCDKCQQLNIPAVPSASRAPKGNEP